MKLPVGVGRGSRSGFVEAPRWVIDPGKYLLVTGQTLSFPEIRASDVHGPSDRKGNDARRRTIRSRKVHYLGGSRYSRAGPVDE